MELNLSDHEKLFIIHGLEDNFRNDGRGREDFRQAVLERNVLATTDGSCRVRLGSTDILSGVKLELETVESNSKSPRIVSFFVDFSANASVQFAGKGGDIFAEELTSALQEAYSNAQDIIPSLEKAILSDQQRWKIHVDLTVLQWDGSVLDALSIAVIGALSDVEIPELDVRPDDGGRSALDLHRIREGADVRDEDAPVATWKLDVHRCPILVSVAKIGTTNVVDCTPEEESCIRSQLWVGLVPSKQSSEDNDVTLVKQVGGGMLETVSISEMVDVAVRSSRKLRTSLNKHLDQEQPRLPGCTFLL